MEDLRSVIYNVSKPDSYKRVDTSNIVAWYAGIDGKSRPSLFCITNEKPVHLLPSRLIDIYVGQRKDGKFGITFSLVGDQSIDLFLHFCYDMIDHSRFIRKTDSDANVICARYVQWQKAFVKNNGKILSFEEIKGLIGELIVLKNYMIPKYGEEIALKGWTGIELTDQDFSYEDTWYESKTCVSGSATVKISSIEQLDTTRKGHLAVVTLDKTSQADSSHITLNSVVASIKDSIGSNVLKDIFIERLLDFGYIRDEQYDEICFRYYNTDFFLVDDNFPCVRRKQVPDSALNLKYELSLSSVSRYKEDL